MASWSLHWKSSTSARKQRNYASLAPAHIRRKFISAPLSKELRAKHNTRTVRLRVGDKVTIMRGQFRKRTGKIERVDVDNTKVYVTGIETIKKDGSKATYPINPSNLQVTELTTGDKRRLKQTKEKKQ
jgi:large subunit ribosomal protein L24